MEQENSEDLRRRFRELAAAMEGIHDEWQQVVDRNDLLEEKRLIARESELLAEIDKVVKAFRNRIAPSISGKGTPREK